MLLSCSYKEVDLIHKFAFAYFLASKTSGEKALSKKFHIHFKFYFHSNVWLLRKVKCMLYQNNY